ncbi:hypothetical protein BJ912DRAFT_948021, partial [Pholiota molesta]
MAARQQLLVGSTYPKRVVHLFFHYFEPASHLTVPPPLLKNVRRCSFFLAAERRVSPTVRHRVSHSHAVYPRPDHQADEFTNLDALSRANQFLRNISLPLLYQRLEVNVQRRGFQRRMNKFIALLRTNPLLATFIRVLIITDNTIQFAHRNETQLRLNQTASGRWLSRWDMLEDARYRVFSDEQGMGQQLADAVRTMDTLRTVIISFVYTPVEWTSLSSHFRSGFQHAIGVNNVPRRLLERFPALGRLDLVDASVDAVSDPVDRLDDTPEVAHSQNRHARLSALGLRNVPATGALSLLQFWKEDAVRTHHGVDMSSPRAIDIFFGDAKECAVPRQALLHASRSLKTLQLHALALGLDNKTILRAEHTGFPMEHPAESGGHESFSDWFRFASLALVRPGDLAGLVALEELSVQVSHWPDRVGPNGELQWALKLVQRVPTTHLRALTVRVNVGSYLGSDNAALEDFAATIAPLWSPWGEELRDAKWSGLESVVLELLGPIDIVAYDFRRVALRLLKSISMQFPRVVFRRRKTRFQLRYLLRTED